MLVSSLITWCNGIYEPDTTDYKLSDNDWIAYFNEALADLKPYLRLKAKHTDDLVEDTGTYTMPTDFYKMFIVQIKAETDADLERIDEVTIEDNYSKGYKLWEDITIQPTPTESVTDGLVIHYFKEHSEITATTDDIEISNPYLVGLYALGRVETGDRVLDISNRYFNEYADGVQKLRLNEVLPYNDYSIEDVY